MQELFMTLCAKQFLTKYNVTKDKNTNNHIIHYSFDYTNAYDRHYYISSQDTQDDCALLYQLKQSYPSGKKYIEGTTNTALVFVDFEGIFERMSSPNTKELMPASYKKDDLSPYSKKINNNIRLQYLFRDGFQIKYSDDLTITYVPFEKSNSMARNSKMSFIAKELFDDINKRLHLDIPFHDMSLTLSKFFAYKGLYLSSGTRIKCKDLILNEETVVVIEDVSFRVKNQSIITAKNISQTNKWEVAQYDDYTVSVGTAFDGEGLISPEYADKINRSLSHREKKATSFQIRMPFSKGMLHEVDFPKFLSEYASCVPENGYYIKDAFGEVRDLKKAQIIMSVSMFKAFAWLKKYVESLPEKVDPMKYYFSAFRKYGHALYISNTNLSIRRTGYTTLGYQMLNTLQLTKKQMDSIAATHLKETEDPVKYLLSGNQKMPEDTPTWMYALSKSHVFTHDSEIKSQLTQISNGLKSKSGNGRFLVEGESRYLSRDLLLFLTRLLRLMNDYSEKGQLSDKIKELEKQNLYNGRFYMPNSYHKLSPDKYCAVFRSPHLSRNEQCALRPFNADIYCEYFSHLSGIIMMSFKSLDPQALGGADFDGDQVKVIHNKDVVDAVLAGSYKYNKGKNIYERKLPLICIPSPGGTSVTGCKYGSFNYYKTIKNTFSNRVGQISNMAIRLGQIQYVRPNAKLKHTCAECTIFTGLEIDAAKSGVHPDLSELMEYCKSLKPEFEYINDFLNPFTKHNKTSHHTCYEADVSHLIKKKGAGLIQPLAYLPYYYKEHTKTIWSPEVLDSEKVSGRYQYFTFLENRDWKKTLDTEKIKKINAVISAYNSVLKISRNVNRFIAAQKSNTFAGHIRTIISLQYDTDKASLFFEETYMKLFYYLEENFQSTKDVLDSLTRLREKNWPFLLKEQRKDALMYILNIEITDGNRELLNYLLNFNANGCYLLFYFLQDVLSVKADTSTREENATYYKENLSENLSETDQSLYKEMFDEFFKIYLEADSLCHTDKLWRETLFQKCKLAIDGLMSPESPRIKLLYAATDRSFFWEYFSPEDLDPYLLPTEEMQC